MDNNDNNNGDALRLTLLLFLIVGIITVLVLLVVTIFGSPAITPPHAETSGVQLPIECRPVDPSEIPEGARQLIPRGSDNA